ncbi:hypothetical protein ABIB48_002639 [Arthrobacter sp. UYCu511]
MIDQELFALCKEVFERTRWQPSFPQWSYTDLFSNGEFKRMQGRNGTSIPEYTSDYLLEKLIRKYHESYNGDSVYISIESGGNIQAVANVGGADERGSFFTHVVVSADNPLKALLKLGVALDDAGELTK